jgi:hypothetical protein
VISEKMMNEAIAYINEFEEFLEESEADTYIGIYRTEGATLWSSHKKQVVSLEELKSITRNLNAFFKTRGLFKARHLKNWVLDLSKKVFFVSFIGPDTYIMLIVDSHRNFNYIFELLLKAQQRLSVIFMARD